MAKKAVNTRARVSSPTVPLTFDNILVHQPHEPAAWVRDMQVHFVEHGYYRGRDLNRLLGPPGASTAGSAVVDFSKNGFPHKKK